MGCLRGIIVAVIVLVVLAVLLFFSCVGATCDAVVD